MKELLINGETYSYCYKGQPLMSCPKMNDYNVTSTDIENYEKFQSKCKKYNDKIADTEWSLCKYLGTPITIIEILTYIYCNFHTVFSYCLKFYSSTPIWVILYLIFVFSLPFCWALMMASTIQGVLFYHFMPKRICIWLVKLLMKKPVPPRNMAEIEKYSSDFKIYNDNLMKYETEYVGIQLIDYDIEKFGQECVDGLILKLTKYAEEENKRIKEHNMRQSRDYWFKLDPYDFEEEVAHWYEKKGYKATVTAKSGDGGVDIILQKGGESMYVQCKRFTSSKVDRPTLNALYGVMCADGVRKGAVACLLGTTSEAKEFAEKVGIEIVTIKQLCPRIDLFHNINLREKIDATPKKNNEWWCQIGNVMMQTICYQTEESAQMAISTWKRKELYHPLLYRGVYFIVYLGDNNFESVENWVNERAKQKSKVAPTRHKSRYYSNYYRS